MIEIKEIFKTDEKSDICNSILRALPNWFGVEVSIVAYVEAVASLTFFAAVDEGRVIGFATLKTHSPYASEIYVMGVLSGWHRRGAGRRLIQHCEDVCRKNKAEFLTVKTLDESREDENYAQTRLFYHAMGFKPLEVFPLLWDKNNPCLLMIKKIAHLVDL